MKTLKKLKFNVIISSVIYVALGVILLIWPEMTAKNICYVVGVISIAVGVVNLIDYIRKDYSVDAYRYNLVYGMVFILLGIFIFVKVETVISIIPVLLGFAVTISGLLKFQNAVDLVRMKYNGWGIVMIVSILNVAFGVVLIMNPFTSAMILFICIGIGMIYSGVSDLIATIMLSRSIKSIGREIEKAQNQNIVN
ncbi:MAG: DUF308 domain-containing protein [Lachnospiraceae bacterium]|nr:DUF308 domain-containing protein [Lachnospiraceae bacterium]